MPPGTDDLISRTSPIDRAKGTMPTTVRVGQAVPDDTNSHALGNCSFHRAGALRNAEAPQRITSHTIPKQWTRPRIPNHKPPPPLCRLTTISRTTLATVPHAACAFERSTAHRIPPTSPNHGLPQASARTPNILNHLNTRPSSPLPSQPALSVFICDHPWLIPTTASALLPSAFSAHFTSVGTTHANIC
jgi:hypothetical protein